jgi:hypothetical protein
MPPSGFTKEFADHMGNAMEDCSDELLKEVAAGKWQNLKAAIAGELASIRSVLADSDVLSSVERGELQTTKGYYELVMGELSSGDYTDEQLAVAAALRKFKAQTMAIHIADGKLAKRST